MNGHGKVVALAKEEPELPEPYGWLLRKEVELAESLKEKIRATEDLVKKLAEGDEAVEWLRILPDVGGFFSVLIRHEGGEMERSTPDWSLPPTPLARSPSMGGSPTKAPSG